jgi:hypothetical protein
MSEFVALLHANRSGSTLLSRLIATHGGDIFVFPETPFLLKIVMLHKSGRLRTPEDVSRAITDDPRHDALGASRDEISSICVRHGVGDIGGILEELAFNKCGFIPKVILIKFGDMVYFWDELVLMFPGIRFLHIIRDPRAVVSSMIRSELPEKKGFNMARNSIIFAARTWCTQQSLVEKLKQFNDVLEVRYEELIVDQSETLRKIKEHFALYSRRSNDRNNRRSSYNVAKIDDLLHFRVNQSVDVTRNDAWQAALIHRQVAIVERICRKRMLEKGYHTHKYSMSLTGLAAEYARHFWGVGHHYVGTLWLYLKAVHRWPSFKLRIELSVAQARAKKKRCN